METDERENSIRALFPLVKKIARRVHRLVPSVDVDDLVGDGSIGLIRAVDHFDPDRGPSLELYARQLIVGAMLNGIRRMDPVSERTRRTMRDGEAERYRLATEHGYLPSVAEMERVRPGFERAALAAHQRVPLSLDAPLPEGERVVDDWRDDPARIIAERGESEQVKRAIDALPERHRRLVHAHYYAEQSLREIGRAMRISPQRASQLHLAAIAGVRKRLHAAAR